ncbi:unnamed protein product [Ostreobium quekettii]|uniref:BTB domain-containing protein n=1 Tax=Ostreobium quekettii TaxID=121088 RepID=A0A8S1J0K4_9CHLO|nr:unnamed protein product [Ostreobium quekettii]|eukprot:evm.model.scf_1466.3 EVM.evm.TU.scf_1466.3   scf_1466:12099-15629(-)
MVVYDVTDEGSFHSMQSFFVPEIRKRGRENAPVLLVGNKTDKCIGRAEDCQLAKGFAVDNKMPFLEVCAWEAKTVHRAFMTLVRAVMGRPCCPSAETEDCIPDICGDYGKLCDVTLVVQGTELPAHSQVLALESCFFRKMFADLLGDGQSRDGGTLRVPLDDSISVEDAKTLIAFLYHRRSEVDEVKEAELLTWMADKYDVPRLLWICETKLCEVADQMYNSMLAEERADQRARTVWRSTHEHLDAALWLSEAERLGMDRLVKSCRRLVLRPRQKRTETAGTATHIATSVRNLISDAVLKMQGVRFRRIFGRSSPLGELADD